MVKISNGPKYLVGIKPSIDIQKIKSGVRVCLDINTFTIMKLLEK